MENKMLINIAGGRGIMGKVHKPVFEAAGHKVIISGRNTSPNLEEAARISDITIVSVPIEATEEIIRKIAPYCRAIMDFTSLKKFPIEAMLKYSPSNCEVGGLHPLYGSVSSIKGRAIVYCPTKKSGEKCREVVRSLESAGAKIIVLDAEEHDKKMAVVQNARKKLFEAYALLVEQAGFDIKELYEVSPPPTRILMDLIARQVDKQSEGLYNAIERYNPNDKKIRDYLIDSLKDSKDAPKKIRKLFGDELGNSQERARKLIDKS